MYDKRFLKRLSTFVVTQFIKLFVFFTLLLILKTIVFNSFNYYLLKNNTFFTPLDKTLFLSWLVFIFTIYVLYYITYKEQAVIDILFKKKEASYLLTEDFFQINGYNPFARNIKDIKTKETFRFYWKDVKMVEGVQFRRYWTAKDKMDWLNIHITFKNDEILILYGIETWDVHKIRTAIDEKYMSQIIKTNMMLWSDYYVKRNYNDDKSN